MRINHILVALIGIVLLGGCATKEIKTQQAAFIILNTPTFKYADMGFISETNNGLNLQIYTNAQPVLALDITNSKICMSRFECLTKKSFNSKFLDASYPEDTLENILLGKPIYEGIGHTNTKEGFIQKIQIDTNRVILYEVLGNQIVFNDKIKNINIKVIKQ